VLDEALVLFFPAPGSFTGEDVVEFHVHGSPAVVRRCLEEWTAVSGVRLAEPGEFTLRAYQHGRLDLTQVESLRDLIDSDTEEQRRQALLGLSGALRFRGEDWRGQLLRLSALLNASIDFSDEGDVPETLMRDVLAGIKALAGDMAGVLATAQRGLRVRAGLHVALAGPPNAGKSALLNALAKRDAAIVSPIAGTTRDVIEVALDLHGWRVVLFDTAGLRESDDALEQEGMRRASRAMEAADVVLWLQPVDAPRQAPPAIRGRVIEVISKADLARGSTGHLAVSALTGTGLAELEAHLLQAAGALSATGEAAIVSHERQRLAIERAADCLALAAEQTGSPELCAFHLQEAVAACERLVGRIGVEEMLGEIFGRFCIGK
jgi:tRNA modification GTPase